MAYKAYQLTLTGAAQRLSDVFGLPATTPESAAAFVSLDIPFRQLSFQSLKANAADIFIGDGPTVSTTVHAIRVDPGDTQPPIILGHFDDGPMKLSDFYVIGTANDVLLVGGIPY